MSTMTSYRPEVKPLGLAPRAVNGFYCDESSPYAVREVELVNGRIGFQVGPCGMIFAVKAKALTFAAARREKADAAKAKIEAEALQAKAVKAKTDRIEAVETSKPVAADVPAYHWASSILGPLSTVATPEQRDFARYLLCDDQLGGQSVKVFGPSLETLRSIKAALVAKVRPIRHRRVDAAKARRLAVAR
jgi:hypothetical protein